MPELVLKLPDVVAVRVEVHQVTCEVPKMQARDIGWRVAADCDPNGGIEGSPTAQPKRWHARWSGQGCAISSAPREDSTPISILNSTTPISPARTEPTFNSSSPLVSSRGGVSTTLLLPGASDQPCFSALRSAPLSPGGPPEPSSSAALNAHWISTPLIWGHSCATADETSG